MRELDWIIEKAILTDVYSFPQGNLIMMRFQGKLPVRMTDKITHKFGYQGKIKYGKWNIIPRSLNSYKSGPNTWSFHICNEDYMLELGADTEYDSPKIYDNCTVENLDNPITLKEYENNTIQMA